MSKTQDEQNAARAILSAAQRAASEPGVDIMAVNLRPGDPLRNVPAVCLVAWTAGAAWGELKLEFRRLPMHLIPADKPQGFWTRVNGTASTPMGFPMLPAGRALLSDIANAACDCADVHLPRGCHFVAAAE